MEFETTEAVRSTPSRHEKSLGLLTMKFVSLLQGAKDGVLDLKVVSEPATGRLGGVVLRGVFVSRALCRSLVCVNKGPPVTHGASQVR